MGSKKLGVTEFHALPRVGRRKSQDLERITWPGIAFEGIKWPSVLDFWGKELGHYVVFETIVRFLRPIEGDSLRAQSTWNTVAEKHLFVAAKFKCSTAAKMCVSGRAI
jgi:hypothetical protein